MSNTEMIERVEMTRAITLRGKHELVISVHLSKGGVSLGQCNYRISEEDSRLEFIRSWVLLANRNGSFHGEPLSRFHTFWEAFMEDPDPIIQSILDNYRDHTAGRGGDCNG